MTRILLFYYILLTLGVSQIPQTTVAQKHKNQCGLEVISAEPVVLMDALRYYKVVIENRTSKTVDAVEWDAFFYNAFGEKIGTHRSQWAVSTLSKPVGPGKKITDRKKPDETIKHADRIEIRIRRVHFKDDSACP